MKKTLLLQYRDDISKDHEAKCFLEKLRPVGVTENNFKVVNAILDDFDDSPEYLLAGVCAVIIGASGQYDLSKNPPEILKALNKTQNIFKYIFETDFPTLGVCFGHQTIAYKLGAQVKPINEMAESGSIEVTLTDEANQDNLFRNLPKNFLTTLGHKESVINVPKEIVILAHSKKCPVQAYRYKNNIYGVQFHPELGPDDVFYRWSLYPEYLKGKDINEVRKGLKETPDAVKLLQEFVVNTPDTKTRKKMS